MIRNEFYTYNNINLFITVSVNKITRYKIPTFYVYKNDFFFVIYLFILKRFRLELFFLQILCEVSMAIYDINETPEPHVSRDIMPIESRISRDNQSLRDWLILREYMTSLQYVIEAFGYLKSKR